MKIKILSSLFITLFTSLLYSQKGQIQLIPNLIYRSAKENLGRAINTKYDEKCPIISPDGKTLFFSRGTDPLNIGGSKKPNQDVWFSTIQENGNWGQAQNLGEPINNDDDNGISSTFPDNNSLLIFGTYEKNGKRKGNGISISKRTNTGWSLPQNQYINNFYHQEGPLGFYLCNDKKTLLMSIYAKDTKGKNDIYVSFLLEDKTWSAPKNIGPVINTSEIEGVPFMSSDNKTIFFASKGHPGYGGADIFTSTRLDDSWTNWSEPKNMGEGINTKGDEWRINIPASGDYAYFSSTDGSIGGEDIFRIQMPVVVKPKPFARIYGKVYEPLTNSPVETEIVYIDLKTGQKAGFANSSPVDGNYQIILPGEKNYAFYTRHPDYYPISENLDLSNLNEYQQINKDLLMVKIKTISVGQRIRLNNIFFETNKSELKSESFEELDRLINLLNSKPSLKIQISGHTDNIGTEAHNLSLSEERAKAVVVYLTGKGIDASRLNSKGYGFSDPVASNDTEEGRAQNRRVEFKVLEE
jgi:outer membrane protein OmpA-like peptidoglycan-associated protein